MDTTRSISFTLNGSAVNTAVRPQENLVEVLQRCFGLSGARESCGQGLCGCCSVKVNGRVVSGCLFLAVFADGCSVSTVEGLDHSGALSPVQEAWIEAGALQCGYCTSGFILMATELLQDIPHPTDEQIKDYLSGNLCRCGCYPEILRAVHMAAEKIDRLNSLEAIS